jgi:predicted phosphoribosyltransferase
MIQGCKMFRNRKEAGQQLAVKLKPFAGRDSVVLAIPRGGVPVGVEVAKKLEAEVSMVITRKLPFPYNPEAGFGAIAEDGSNVIMRGASHNLSKAMIETIIRNQQEEIDRRIKVLRGGRPLPNIADRTVILVDDGIAMGSTMRASIKLCVNQGAEQIIVAAPVASPEMAHALEQKESVSDVVILLKPRFFRAVAQVYENWYDVPDHEVLAAVNQWQKESQP